MSLHAAELAEHMKPNLIRYRARRLWRPAFLGDFLITRKRRYVRAGQGLLGLILILSIYALYFAFFRKSQPGLAAQTAFSARRHRLKKPNEPDSQAAPELEPLPILPINRPFDAEEYDIVPKEKVTVVLPVDGGSYAHLPSLLAPFFINANRPGEIIVASPASLVGEVDAVVKATLLTLRNVDLSVQVRAWQEDLGARVGWLHVAASSTKDFILLLDENGTHEIDAETLAILLEPKALPYPVGPRGVSFSPTNVSCIAHTADSYVPVAFLLPPFVIPTTLLREADSMIRMNDMRIWFSLGERISGLTHSGSGGLARTPFPPSATSDTPQWCHTAEEQVLDPPSSGSLNPRQAVHERYRSFQVRELPGTPELPIRIVLMTMEELFSFAFTICRMAGRGQSIRVHVVEASSDPAGTVNTVSAGGCHIHYDLPSSDAPIESLQTWILRYCQSRSILLHTITRASDALLLGLLRIYATSSSSSLIWLPAADLHSSGWMGELTSEELQKWHLPHVELCVITNNRPASLRRLLTSVQRAYYYGDKPLLTVSLEESADAETLRIIRELDWPGGGAHASGNARLLRRPS